MHWFQGISYFFGGVVLTNAIPHFVNGTMGRAFPTPFAKPRGEGTSPPTLNVLWGCLNLIVAYLLIAKVGVFDMTTFADAGALGAGAVLMGVFLARRFGALHS